MTFSETSEDAEFRRLIPAIRALTRAIEAAEAADYNELSRRVITRATDVLAEKTGDFWNSTSRPSFVKTRPTEGLTDDGQGTVSLIVNLTLREAVALEQALPQAREAIKRQDDAAEALLHIHDLLRRAGLHQIDPARLTPH